MEKDFKNIRIILGIFLGVLIIYLLAVLKIILIPLVLAIYFGLLLQPMISWLIKHKIPKGIATATVLISSLGLLFIVGDVIFETSVSFYEKRHLITEDLHGSMDVYISTLNKVPGIDIDDGEPMSKVLQNLISFEWIKSSSASIASNLGNTTFSIIIMLIYLMAILGGIVNYKEYLRYLSSDNEEDSERIISAFENVRFSILSYMKVKTIASLGTGLGFWIVCLIFDIRFAAFWGFMAFVLNYIPTVGSIVATVPPFLLGLIHIDHLGMFFLYLGLLLFIQLFFGNIVEPKMHGSRLSLNTATVLFGLIFWGHLWGAVGLLLSVPLMVLLRIILLQLPNARMAALLMGSNSKNKELSEELNGNTKSKT